MRTPPKNRLNLTGLTFGRLTVTKEGEREKEQRRWYCLCECGNTVLVLQASLRSGSTTSCGCLHSEVVSNTFSTHRLSRSPEYLIWSSMKRRCYNQRNIGYALYGGRGIKVCDRWRNDFLAFLNDMGPRPSLKHSLDRIDNDRDYEPGNCRWATIQEQGRNKRSNHFLTFDGKTLTIAEWAELTNIPQIVLRSRINANRWSVERALTTPYKSKK